MICHILCKCRSLRCWRKIRFACMAQLLKDTRLSQYILSPRPFPSQLCKRNSLEKKKAGIYLTCAPSVICFNSSTIILDDYFWHQHRSNLHDKLCGMLSTTTFPYLYMLQNNCGRNYRRAFHCTQFHNCILHFPFWYRFPTSQNIF